MAAPSSDDEVSVKEALKSMAKQLKTNVDQLEVLDAVKTAADAPPFGAGYEY